MHRNRVRIDSSVRVKMRCSLYVSEGTAVEMSAFESLSFVEEMDRFHENVRQIEIVKYCVEACVRCIPSPFTKVVSGCRNGSI